MNIKPLPCHCPVLLLYRFVAETRTKGIKKRTNRWTELLSSLKQKEEEEIDPFEEEEEEEKGQSI